MRKLLLAVAAGLILAPMLAWGQVGRLARCNFADRGRCGVAADMDVLYILDDGAAVNACAAGGGANDVLCFCEGTTCVAAVDDAGTSALPGTTAGTFTVDSDGAPGTAIVDTTGAGTIQIGSADVTAVTVLTDGGTVTLDGTLSAPGAVTLENSDSLNTAVDATFDFTRDDTGIVTFTCSDDDAVAGCTYDAGGASPVVVGSADVTSVTISSDRAGTVVIDGANITSTKSCTHAECGEDGSVVNRFVGIPKISMVGSNGVLADGTATTFVYMDDSPEGECAPITSGTEAAEATITRIGSGSYKYTWDATGTDNHGWDCDVTGPVGNGFDSFGFWLYSDTTFASGDLDATLDDGGVAEGNAVIGAYSTANEWQWMEVDFGADCDASCGDIDGIFIQATAQAPTTFNASVMYVDAGAVWTSGAEEPIGDVLVDGVLSVVTIVNADAGGQTHEITNRTEWTDYLVHYQTGADAIVPITDLSTFGSITLQALK